MGSTPPAADTRERLTALRSGLLRFHKTLLESERAAYDRDVQRISSPGQFLTLLLNDPWFEWLRELSGLIVVIDETLEAKEGVTREDAEDLIERTRTLLVPAENGAGFAKRYDDAMQRDPEVILAHGEMMRVLVAVR